MTLFVHVIAYFLHPCPTASLQDPLVQGVAALPKVGRESEQEPPIIAMKGAVRGKGGSTTANTANARRRARSSSNSSSSGKFSLQQGDAADWVVRWEKECLDRLGAMEAGHDKARRSLVAKLESQVSQTNFSSYLTDMIQKEERAAAQVSPLPHINRAADHWLGNILAWMGLDQSFSPLFDSCRIGYV